MQGFCKHSLRNRASALILSLVILVSAGTLAAAAAAMGLYLSTDSRVSLLRSRDYYAAESALNRTIFYLKDDLSTYPERTLGENDYHGRNDLFPDRMRFLADGVEHLIPVPGSREERRVVLTDEGAAIPIPPVSTLMQRLEDRRNRLAGGK